jgi:hypothetical protein
MNVDGKRALVMLIVVVLWIAMPAFSCFLPTPQHACCHGMSEAMPQSCNAPAMSHQSCCQVHRPDANLPLVRASAPEYPLTLAGPSANVPIRHTLNAANLQWAAPPASPPSDNSILRI